MSVSIGDKLGPYEILASIGKGGMGEVYRARDGRLDRDVAVKVSAEQFSERFEREARVIASLNHPNICTLHDVGPNYLVMELVEGLTLAERISHGAISLDESLNVARQIADALEAAHEKGITHRDLKPGNVKIKPDGSVKVLDFGLAKTDGVPAVQSEHSPTLTVAQTEVGMILGTVGYMAPEQAKGKPVDKRADIWAFGVVLYEMLTGKRPFTGETTTEVLAAIIERKPKWDRVPPQVQRLLRMCLEKDPQKRLRHIANVMALVNDDPAASAVIASPMPARKRWLWPSVATLLSVTTLGLLALYFRQAAHTGQPMSLQISVPDKLIFNAGTAGTISPDGRWLAFPATGSDNVARMWIRPLNSPEVKPLEGTEVSPFSPPPFWSFDSRFIAFGTPDGKLKKVEITGGQPKTICEMQTGAVNGGIWNKDGVIVFGSLSGALTGCSTAGGPASPMTVLSAGETAHRWPQFLPDGRHFLYTRAAGGAEKNGIFVGSLDAKPDQQNLKPLLITDRQGYYVPSEVGGPGWLLFVRESTIMAQRFDPGQLELSGEPVPVGGPVGSFPNANFALFSVSETGILVYRGGGGAVGFQLTWFDSGGNRTGVIGDPGLYTNTDLSPNGKRVAVRQSTAQGNLDVTVLDVTRGTPTRLTFDPARDDYPIWSSDGNKIVFSSNRGGGHLDLYQKASDGSGEDQLLLKSDEDKRPESWSPNGRYLLYRATSPKTGDDLWVLPLEGDHKPFPFLHTEFRETQGQFSPDSRWVAYASNETGTAEVYVRPFAPNASGESSSSGVRWMISKGGGDSPRWRANDGKQLYYMSLAGAVMSVDVTADKTFYSEVPRRLFDAGASAGNGRPSLTSDGKRFLFPAPLLVQGSGAALNPFMVVLNWQAALKK